MITIFLKLYLLMQSVPTPQKAETPKFYIIDGDTLQVKSNFFKLK